MSIRYQYLAATPMIDFKTFVGEITTKATIDRARAEELTVPSGLDTQTIARTTVITTNPPGEPL